MTLATRPFDPIPLLDAEDAPRPPDPDRDVIALVRRGEVTRALALLMTRHGRPIYRYCCEELHDTALAEDVQQQVFVAAFHSLPHFEGRSSLRAWLFGIARHRVLDAVKLRGRDRARLVQAADEPAITFDARLSPGEALDELRLREALRAELARLPEPVRTAIVLQYQHGLSIAEIAKVLHEKPGTISARVLRALPVLHEQIAARLRPPLGSTSGGAAPARAP